MQSSPANAERLLQQGSPGEADGSLYTQLPKSGPKLPSLRILTPDSCYKSVSSRLTWCLSVHWTSPV